MRHTSGPSDPSGTDETAPTLAAGRSGTAHALATFVPPPLARRRGIALCLSGGGYRAALFHLGGLRRLHEVGVLAQLDEITSVSGGSITAAVLAYALAASGGPTLTDLDAQLARPLRAFTRRNIRTPALVRRLLPWNWFRADTGARQLVAAYRSMVPDFACSQLPVRPDFVFCSTDMAFGVSWTFTRAAVGDYMAGTMAPRLADDVATAVAASSCFPPIFNPLDPRVSAADLTGGQYDKPDRAAHIAGLRLTDGGAYDNLGLEPAWKGRSVVLVSDGGGPFEASSDQGLVWRIGRYTDILYRQVGALRKRWLIASFIAGAMQGTYWGVAGATSNYDQAAPGYPDDVADELIARIRTDLDAFSDAEAAVLENHGYALADAAVQRHVPGLIATPAPFRVPNAAWDWTHIAEVRAALAKSHERKLLGRW